jgi:hypothetical protein
MKWAEFLSKGEALAKQVTSQAVALAQKAKEEEWVKQVSNAVTEVWRYMYSDTHYIRLRKH